jgi:pyruvate formate lyase activating enzyme
MEKALLWKKENGKIRCQLCHHKCLISDGNAGLCRVRKNIKNILFSLNYGLIAAENIDPIEKKPLYHFLPNSQSYSIGSPGCNFACKWCQNQEISQISKNEDIDWQKKFSNRKPKDIVISAIKNTCKSISYTYTEPTIFFEFALDTMKLAKENGLKNVWVSNGYFTSKVLKKISPYLDAINIDLKAFDNKTYQKLCGGANLNPVLKNIKSIINYNIHLELTSLIIPDINDSETELKMMAKFIAKLDPEIPWHLSRFFPYAEMRDSQITPRETLEKARQIGRKFGLKNIYLGNI